MKRFVLLIVFLLMVGVVHAEFSQNDAVDWLDSNIICSRAPIEEVAFATIALNSDACLNQLKTNRIDASGCFPKDNCNTKDTALATLALYFKGQPIENQLGYLEERLTVADGFNNNQWIIQIVTSGDGTCSIFYDGNEENGYTVTFDENGELPAGGSWVSFGDLTPTFVFNEAVETLRVDCSDLTNPIQKVSIIKNVDNSFEIVDERDSEDVEFEIANGCYTANENSNDCDTNVEASFYASWVLNEIGRNVVTKNYLTVKANNDLYYAMLSKIDSSFLSDLVDRQEGNDDSFSHNVKITSFAVNALEDSIYTEERGDAMSWVEDQQIENGKIGTGVLDTAAALYLIYSNAIAPPPEDGDDEGSGNTCTENSDCEIGEECVNGGCQAILTNCVDDTVCTASEYVLGNCADCYGCGDGYCSSLENPVSCPSDCQEDPSSCNNDGFCDFGENEVNCPFDCTSGDDGGYQPQCGDGICESGEDAFTCAQDCEADRESGGSLWWLWLIIIIVVIGGIAFFILSKMKKGKPRGGSPSYLGEPRAPPRQPQPRYRAPVRRRAPRDKALESELDASIKQAQDLLKKKK